MVIVALNSSIDDESYNRYHSTALLELMHIIKSKIILFHTDSAYIFDFQIKKINFAKIHFRLIKLYLGAKNVLATSVVNQGGL